MHVKKRLDSGLGSGMLLKVPSASIHKLSNPSTFQKAASGVKTIDSILDVVHF